MDIPLFHLDFLNNRSLIAIIAILHVVINHALAVGAMPLVAFLEWKALRDGDTRLDDFAFKALRTAFVTPLDAEDLFILSAELDEILNGVKDTTREAEVMSIEPDNALAEMADHLIEGVDHLRDAFEALNETKRDEVATAAADHAVKCVRLVERVYRRAMPRRSA